MEEKKKNESSKETETLREESVKELLLNIFPFGNGIILNLEQNLLHEILINKKDFSELSEPFQIIAFNKISIFTNTLKRLNEILKSMPKSADHEKLKRELCLAYTELEITRNELIGLKEFNTRVLPTELQNLLKTPIEKLNFSSRFKYLCASGKIATVSDLVKLSKLELLKILGSSKKCIAESELFLDKMVLPGARVIVEEQLGDK